MNRDYPINRSGNFLLYYQTEGRCDALRLAMQSAQTPGPATIGLVRQLRERAQRIGTGEPFEQLPEINEESPIIDVLVAAEVIRTTMLAFLTPEEVEEQRRTFGFRTPGH